MNSKIRKILGGISLILSTLLFLDFTGCYQSWFGWMAKIQFMPALLSLNFIIIIALILLTLLMGRIYCSVICPLGILQDVFGWFGKKAKKNRYTYSKPMNILRYVMLAVLVGASVAGFASIAALIAPYSAFGRIASNILAPVYLWGNNLLADWAESVDSYSFYSVDIWVKGGITLVVSVITFIVLFVLAYKNGRTYCNTICPVGTILGFFSRFSYLKPIIDTSKCNGCGLCARNCKASCIDSKNHAIDYSRCVVCLDCIDKCKQGAIKYVPRTKAEQAAPMGATADKGRRAFITTSAIMAGASVAKAQQMKMDGGFATIEDKKIPNRETLLTPPGSLSAKNFSKHCTACQLCITVCENQVLRPSNDWSKFMQPEVSYERGYCRPECTKCSEVCPTGAIKLITREEKTAIQIGHAVWVAENCIVNTDGQKCGNCARHCPSGAIQMVPKDANDPKSLQIPVVNTERCIGCGACENLCPSRPFSAIYVEGHEVHREI
ncbi:MAG: 4Fe-4S binding protein [Bacteroides sp.]|nr:4Fe-4S binding protein [Bacteroides sp.]MBQ8874797.1 4Fe-4S binding protein [Bacteroides sp.]